MSRAENKERYKIYDHDYYIKHKRPKSKIGQAEQKISDLEAKLAEKEKEIENITTTHLDMLRYFIRHNSKQGIILSSDLEREIKEIEQGEKIWQTKNFTQDKISFAIAELEKVKNIIKNKVEIIDKRLDKLNIKIVCESTSMQLDTYEEISKEIYNQIEELKKGLD